MAEGKTLGTPSVKCECCEEADSSHFCCDCNQPLCTRCTKQHGRIASTKQHKPIPLEQYRSLASTTTSTGLTYAYCAKHPNKTIEKLCEECLVVVCCVSESGHRGHRLTKGSLDANILQRTSAQKIPGLVEIIQQLREMEDGSPEKIKLYKEAEKLVKSWKNELLDLLNKDADRLIKELQAEIKKQENISAGTATKIQEYIVKTELQMTKLSESFKISNPTKLLDRMSKCDRDIEDVKMYLKNIKVTQDKLKMGDVLPFKDEFDKTSKLLRALFTKTDQNRGQSPLGASCMVFTGRKQRRLNPSVYDKLRLAREASLANQTYPYYTICAANTNVPHQICIFQPHENKVRVLDLNLQEIESLPCNKDILQILHVAFDRFVMIESSELSNVYLLDGRLNILQTIRTPKSGFKARGLCLKEANVVIIAEENTKKCSTRFTKIGVDWDKVDITPLCEENTGQWNGLMAYQDSGHLIYADDSRSLRKIDVRTGKSRPLCTTKKIIGIVCVEGNTVLFGDDDIYKIEDGKDPVMILKLSKFVTGLLPTDNGLVVAADCNLQFYQFQ